MRWKRVDLRNNKSGGRGVVRMSCHHTPLRYASNSSNPYREAGTPKFDRVECRGVRGTGFTIGLLVAD